MPTLPLLKKDRFTDLLPSFRGVSGGLAVFLVSKPNGFLASEPSPDLDIAVGCADV